MSGKFDNSKQHTGYTVQLFFSNKKFLSYRSQYDEKFTINHWDKPLYPYGGRCLYGKTVGLVGFGGIGVQVAKRLAGFNLGRLLYTSRYIDIYRISNLATC